MLPIRPNSVYNYVVVALECVCIYRDFIANEDCILIGLFVNIFEYTWIPFTRYSYYV